MTLEHMDQDELVVNVYHALRCMVNIIHRETMCVHVHAGGKWWDVWVGLGRWPRDCYPSFRACCAASTRLRYSSWRCMSDSWDATSQARSRRTFAGSRSFEPMNRGSSTWRMMWNSVPNLGEVDDERERDDSLGTYGLFEPVPEQPKRPAPLVDHFGLHAFQYTAPVRDFVVPTFAWGVLCGSLDRRFQLVFGFLVEVFCDILRCHGFPPIAPDRQRSPMVLPSASQRDIC